MSWSQNGSLSGLENLGPRMRAGLEDAAHMIGEQLVRQVRQGILTGPKTGRVYGSHQASAPGEYSANETGDLLGSINYELHGIEYITFYARSDHAGYQEYGTSKMGARPNLQMAIEESDGFILMCLEQVMMVAVGGGG